MEPDYFEAIAEHQQGRVGHRGVDLFPVFFGQTVEAISKHDNDVLGDLFQCAVSHGENAFYMTPRPVSEMMARMTLQDSVVNNSELDERSNMTIHDPCCGTGILLIEAS